MAEYNFERVASVRARRFERAAKFEVAARRRNRMSPAAREREEQALKDQIAAFIATQAEAENNNEQAQTPTGESNV